MAAGIVAECRCFYKVFTSRRTSSKGNDGIIHAKPGEKTVLVNTHYEKKVDQLRDQLSVLTQR